MLNLLSVFYFYAMCLYVCDALYSLLQLTVPCTQWNFYSSVEVLQEWSCVLCPFDTHCCRMGTAICGRPS